jgi:hypothetical protein
VLDIAAKLLRAAARLLIPDRTTLVAGDLIAGGPAALRLPAPLPRDTLLPEEPTMTEVSTPSNGQAPSELFLPIKAGDRVAFTPEYVHDLRPVEDSARRGTVLEVSESWSAAFVRWDDLPRLPEAVDLRRLKKV